MHRKPCDLDAVEQDAARRGRELTGHQFEEGALAGTVRPDQTAQLAPTQLKSIPATARTPPKCFSRLWSRARILPVHPSPGVVKCEPCRAP